MLKPIFDDVTQYPYKEGRIFLGKNGPDQAIGLETHRHLITFAGTQAGKGATLIIPNLRRWPHNIFGFDPKGENISLSWEHREALGQRVAAFDPYRVADIPDHLRAAFNPLGDLDPDDPFVPSVIESLAEGLTIRHKAEDAMWDNGGRAVVAGFIAFCVLAADPSQKHLPAVAAQMRKAFRDPTIYDLMADIEHPLLGGLIREAALIGMSAAAGNRQSESYVRTALDQTKWLVTDEALASWLTTSNVSLRDLKEGKLSFFVCLPFDKTVVRPEILKLLLQYAMSVMQRDLCAGAPTTRCLFLLDEAYCMGRVPDIQRNLAGLTAYGVQIWTIWQNVAQLHELYKPEGAAQFFSATDAVMFFGMGEFDDASPRMVAEAIGRAEVRDIDAKLPERKMTSASPDVWHKAYVTPIAPTPPPPTPQGGNGGSNVSVFGDIMSQNTYLTAQMDYRRDMFEHGMAQAYLAMAREFSEAQLHRETTAYNHAMSMRGDYKIPPREIRRITAKAGPNLPSQKMIVFTGRGDVIVPELLPHWEKQVRAPITVRVDQARTDLRQRIALTEQEKEETKLRISELWIDYAKHVAATGEDCRKSLPTSIGTMLTVIFGGLGGSFILLMTAQFWVSAQLPWTLEAMWLAFGIATVIAGFTIRAVGKLATRISDRVCIEIFARLRKERRLMVEEYNCCRARRDQAERSVGTWEHQLVRRDRQYETIKHLTI